MVLTIMTRYNNAPVDEWDAIQAGIDLPNLQRTFAGIFFVDVNITYKNIIKHIHLYKWIVRFRGKIVKIVFV